MGLDILSDTSKNKATKIDQLTTLMSIIHNGNNNSEITENLISGFTNIDAKAPEGGIATDTPWPKALRVFAQAILNDTSSVTIQDRILALTTYLNELKSGASDVLSIQAIRQSNDALIVNSTMTSAEDFLKKISKASTGPDGNKDISLIKAFDTAAAVAAGAAVVAVAAAAAAAAVPATAGGDDAAALGRRDAAAAGLGGGADGLGAGPAGGGDAAAAAATREAKIRADFSDDAKFNETLYKYRLAIARDILKGGNDDQKLNKLKNLFEIYIDPSTPKEDRRGKLIKDFIDSGFPAPNITDIAPLSSVNFRTFANIILRDTDATTAIKISALDSHITELTSFRSKDSIPNIDAFNFYRRTITLGSPEDRHLNAIATEFLNGFTSGNTPTFESAYNAVVPPVVPPAVAPAAAPAPAGGGAAAALDAGGGRAAAGGVGGAG
jgi:hypothetical protein